MNADEVVELLQRKVKECGSTAEFCRRYGVNPTSVYLNMSRVTKNPQPAVLEALGLKRVISYEPKK